MKILFIHWNSFGNEDIIYYFKKMGYKVHIFLLDPYEKNTRDNEPLTKALTDKLLAESYDFIFSFNYFPAISDTANSCSTKYVAWVYDSPYIQIYSHSLANPCNYVFLFDSALYNELKSLGFDTVYYLPMAANVERFDSMVPSEHTIRKYSSDISFVGSLYSDEKNNFYERLTNISDYAHGFLDALVECQKKVYGYFFLPEVLPENILKEMILSNPIAPSKDGFESILWIYANYFLARRVTALERREILASIPAKYKTNLYTKELTDFLPHINNKGYIDYYMQMPYIFKCSKINLNISLKSIQRGIPLRAIDIMGCGGFLLSNYQSDYMDHFEPDKDFVYYNDYPDLLDKIDFYLTHEDARKQIAQNGYRKIRQFHTYPLRIKSIIDCMNC